MKTAIGMEAIGCRMCHKSSPSRRCVAHLVELRRAHVRPRHNQRRAVELSAHIDAMSSYHAAIKISSTSRGVIEIRTQRA